MSDERGNEVGLNRGGGFPGLAWQEPRPWTVGPLSPPSLSLSDCLCLSLSHLVLYICSLSLPRRPSVLFQILLLSFKLGPASQRPNRVSSRLSLQEGDGQVKPVAFHLYIERGTSNYHFEEISIMGL